jgi:hypothetical protein
MPTARIISNGLTGSTYAVRASSALHDLRTKLFKNSGCSIARADARLIVWIAAKSAAAIFDVDLIALGSARIWPAH